MMQFLCAAYYLNLELKSHSNLNSTNENNEKRNWKRKEQGEGSGADRWDHPVNHSTSRDDHTESVALAHLPDLGAAR
jgi:hypothetical protein